MNILISNDDGINSKALITLVKALSDLGNVFVVAPDSERSANSHHFTLKGRMRIEEKEIEGAVKAYALWGTPCDCIHAGLQYIIKEDIDLVVSGINKGWNTISDVIYSGTVAAAREGFMQGKKAIALSLDTFEDRDYTEAAQISKEMIKKFINQESKEYFLNVNIPDMPRSQIKGYKICDTIGRIDYNENYHFEEEFGVNYLAIGNTTMKLDYDQNDINIDNVALKQGYITISPLYNDHVNHKYIEELKNSWE